ncbi:MAG: NADH-quinone oxidoreductase subunit J [Planctomycetia bacterium]
MSGILGTFATTVLPLAAVNWHSVFFLLFAAIACLCAIAVVLADNVVRMALYLVLSLGATAGLFFLAGAEFLGAMQLMIYVGGTLVLLVFGVMLTAQAPFVSIRTTTGDRVLAGLVGAALLAVLLQSAFSVPEWRRPAAGTEAAPAATPIGMALLGVRVDEPAPGTPAGAVRSGYLLPFEIVSVHLLVVLVGAAYLARAKRRKTPRAIEVAASVEPPASAAQHAAVGRRAGRGSSVLAGGRP